MTDPTSSNILLAEPTRGSDSGTWDVPLNGNMTALDGLLGGNTTISLSSATTLTLSVPATGTVAAAAGPNQSQNAVIKFTGTLTGIQLIQLTLPRKYTFDNQCTVGGFLVAIRPASGTGTVVCLPPGEKTEVNFDGVNVDYVGLGRVGSFLDMAVAATPAWITACSVAPYLLCDGATYSTSVYPVLGAMLGSTFGGNGITTFGVPDARGRVRIPLDTTGTRVTSAGSSINGASVGAAGGDQRMQAHTHGVTDPGHHHTVQAAFFNGGQTGSGGNIFTGAGVDTSTDVTGISIVSSGLGASQNMQPSIVFGITFIKT